MIVLKKSGLQSDHHMGSLKQFGICLVRSSLIVHSNRFHVDAKSVSKM